MKPVPREEAQEEEQHVPLSWEQIQAIIRARNNALKRYDGHRSGKSIHTKTTMSKEERRKKRKKQRKARKANRK